MCVREKLTVKTTDLKEKQVSGQKQCGTKYCIEAELNDEYTDLHDMTVLKVYNSNYRGLVTEQ